MQFADRQTAFSFTPLFLAAYHMKKPLNKKIKYLIFIFFLLIIFFILSEVGIYKCTLRALLGIPCPMCGITRAFKTFLQGKFMLSFYYHPLWPLFAVSILLYILYYLGLIKVSDNVFNMYCFCFFGLLIICFIIRHILHSPIVQIEPDSSIIMKVISYHH